jgi:hypothetical protein
VLNAVDDVFKPSVYRGFIKEKAKLFLRQKEKLFNPEEIRVNCRGFYFEEIAIHYTSLVNAMQWVEDEFKPDIFKHLGNFLKDYIHDLLLAQYLEEQVDAQYRKDFFGGVSGEGRN